MSRLALLLILALATWYYFPETRAILLDAAQPVVQPLVRWGIEDEMAQVARNVVDHERLTGQLPAGGAWLEWLSYRYSSQETRTDPWGTTYQLSVGKDSIWILSYGPDRTRATEDDISVSAPRV
jgi:hypothetical protein